MIVANGHRQGRGFQSIASIWQPHHDMSTCLSVSGPVMIGLPYGCSTLKAATLAVAISNRSSIFLLSLAASARLGWMPMKSRAVHSFLAGPRGAFWLGCQSLLIGLTQDCHPNWGQASPLVMIPTSGQVMYNDFADAARPMLQ